jgi:tRNA-specific 2-thiouridylase
VERHARNSRQNTDTDDDPRGELVTLAGNVVGRHEGVHHFTVGQRKGLGISSGDRLYVLQLRPRERQVVVGRRSELERTALTASQVNWIAGDPPDGAISVTAQIRHRHAPANAHVQPIGPDRASVEFAEPQIAVTPGQAVVFYEGDRVLGGGWID